MGVPWVVRKPLSFQSAEWVWAIKKAYLELVEILAHWPLAIWSALVKVTNSAFCEEVPIGRQVASTVLVEVTTVYAAWRFPYLSIRELPSTNRVSWGSVSGWSRRPGQGEVKASTEEVPEREGTEKRGELQGLGYDWNPK